MIENLCLEIANKVLIQLGMTSPNQSAATMFDVELQCEQNYHTDDLLLCVQSNIKKLTPE